jgi:hypothetical protein
MSCAKNRKPLLAGLTSVSSMIGFILMPKCPLCLAAGLSAIGITGVSLGRVHPSLVGLLLLLMIFSGMKLLSLRPSSIVSLALAVAASYAIRLFSTGPLVPLAVAAGVLIAIFFALYWSCIDGLSKARRRFFQAYFVRRRASRIR